MRYGPVHGIRLLCRELKRPVSFAQYQQGCAADHSGSELWHHFHSQAKQLQSLAEPGLDIPTLERTGKRHYVDRLRVEIEAGRGGSGCVAFWRSAAKGICTHCDADQFTLWLTCLRRLPAHAGKFQPADGGNGGHGGNVVVEASAT